MGYFISIYILILYSIQNLKIYADSSPKKYEISSAKFYWEAMKKNFFLSGMTERKNFRKKKDHRGSFTS